MQAQGSSLFNQAYFDALTARINNITDCWELQEAATDAFASVQAQMNAITSQLADIAPLLALLKPPTNLATLISWVTKFITAFVTPYVKPYVTYAAQAAQLAAALVQLQAAIQHAAGNIKTCSVSVPPLMLPTIPPMPEPDPAP